MTYHPHPLGGRDNAVRVNEHGGPVLHARTLRGLHPLEQAAAAHGLQLKVGTKVRIALLWGDLNQATGQHERTERFLNDHVDVVTAAGEHRSRHLQRDRQPR